jgi:hypothetical protein
MQQSIQANCTWVKKDQSSFDNQFLSITQYQSRWDSS